MSFTTALDNAFAITMGYSLHVQRFDGRDAHLEIADLPSVVSVFQAIPWNEEVAQWEKLTEE